MTRSRLPRGTRLALVLAGAAAARAALGAVQAVSQQPQFARRSSWWVTNHRGRSVSLSAGPALAMASAATAAAAMVAGADRRAAAATAGVVLAAAAVGRYDDVAGADPGQRADKGLAGHLRALAAGRVSAGAVKVVGIGGAGLLVARAAGLGRSGLDTVVAGGVIAGTANLVNLLDLRPGRALKVGLLVGVPLLRGRHGPLVAGPLGAAAALLPDDLAERVMLGDAGANALGAALGLRLAAGLGPRGRLGVLAGLAALTVASERVSFTRVIESSPGLRELDRLGRRPAEDR